MIAAANHGLRRTYRNCRRSGHSVHFRTVQIHSIQAAYENVERQAFVIIPATQLHLGVAGEAIGHAKDAHSCTFFEIAFSGEKFDLIGIYENAREFHGIRHTVRRERGPSDGCLPRGHGHDHPEGQDGPDQFIDNSFFEHG